MSRMRTIRSNAPKLLAASKEALKYFIRQDPEPLAETEKTRREIMALLREAVDSAEPPEFDEALTSIRLQMTSATWAALHNVLRVQAAVNSDDKLVLEAVEEGVRETKQRVYVVLSINPRVLRRLVFTLKHKPTRVQDRPFARLAEQIEKEGLTKNPMEILGLMGL